MKINLIASLNGAPIALAYDSTSEITIGRELGNTISPMALDGVSRHHAKIYCKDGAWYVEDLGSSNGTFYKGTKIEGATKLAADDRLQFGPFEVCIHRIEAGDAAPVAAARPVAHIAPVPHVRPVAPAPAPAPAAKPVAPIAPVSPAKPAAPAPAPAPVAKPVAPAPAPAAKPAAPSPAPAPAPAAPAAPAATTQPTVKAVSPLKPLASAGGGIRKPVVGGGALKPGLKLPPKPGLAPGLKLPAKPGLAPGLKLPPKPGASPALKPVAASVAKPADDEVADLEPVEMTPVE